MINRIFTMVIKEGKGTKTLEATNASTPEKPFYGSAYELHRRWTYSYSSTDLNEQGTSLTIQWTISERRAKCYFVLYTSFRGR